MSYDYDANLKIIKQIVNSSLKTGEFEIDKSIDYLNSTIGKMIRPKLVLLGANLYNPKLEASDVEKIHKIAAAIEILHTSSLLHDDIIDEAKLRRGSESVQSRYSKEYALYMGDYLMSKCFMILSDVSIGRELAIRLAKTMRDMCLGEMKQYIIRGKTDISILDYLKIISKKTAFIFALSLSSSAIYLEANQKLSKKLAKIGYYIGMEFQIIDDILDYAGNEDIVGKELNRDVLCGYYNLPIYYSLKKVDKSIVKSYLEKNTDKSIKMLYEHIIYNGAIEDSKKLADRYHSKAMKLLKTLDDSDAKTELIELMNQLNSRLY